MITTNLLFACLGIAFIAFGVIGERDRFKGASLFPELTFKLIAILGAIILVAALIGIVAAFTRRKFLTYIYMIIVIVALVYQVVIGIRVYQKAANPSGYLAPIWATASESYRAHLENEFSCCGYNNAMDAPAVTDTCNPTSGMISTDPPCYDTLNSYVHTAFVRVYAVLFAALAVEVLALSNGITILCTSYIYGDDDDAERRRRRKSGIRLDDMSPDTPTTAGSHNHYGLSAEEAKSYYGAGYKEDTSSYSGRNPRYDSYDMYRQENSSRVQYGDPYSNGRYY